MKSETHVLQIIAGLSMEKPLGGIERFVMDLSRSLQRNGIQITLYGLWQFDTSYEEDWKKTLTGEGLESLIGSKWDPKSPYKSWLTSLGKMKQDLKGHSFHIIHSHNQFGDIIALLLKKYFKSPILVRTVHNEVEWRKRPLRRLFLTNLLYPNIYKAEFGVSPRIIAKLNNRFFTRFLGKPAIYIPNAIDLKRFMTLALKTDQVRASLGLSQDAFIIGSIGRLTEQKGYSFLIQAAKDVISNIPQAKFLLVGSGELENVLKSMTTQLGIQDKVFFLGPRSDIEEILGICDLFVSSSLWEGMPTVIMEGMASGTPIIATNIPGTKELIQDQMTGWLVEPADTNSLAEAILDAFMKPKLREKLSANAVKEVQKFSIDIVADQYKREYLKLAN
jgi:glycosyltransferase involved in cell wall biosynthesis